jgi:hypothetical protein
MQVRRSTAVPQASNAIVVPRAAELEPTLRSVTERLAHELASPGESAPDWSDYEWAVARAVAAMHGISPLLAVSLPWGGPNAWTSFLQGQRSHTLARQLRIQAVLASIAEKACEAGVAVTALKGAALHELGLYSAGDRPMADIDLLVRPSDAERMTALLATLRFGLSGVTWKERIFTPVDETAAAEFGEHRDNSVKIELHERICEKLPWRLTDVSEFIFPAKPRPGLNSYPSNGALMRHLLLHAAGSMAFQGLRILQLHDISLLAERMSESDWNEVAQSPPAARPWWAYPPLDLVSRYYKGRIPSHVLAAMKRDCPFFLRTIAKRTSLVAVSYSHLWVRAFPGIEWSQSMTEMMRYAASRVRPGPDHVAQRARVAKTEAWARQSEWSRFSQSRRIVQWISARQTRPVTMNAIVAALSKRE